MAFPALAASLYRIVEVGFLPVMVVHIVLSTLIWSLTLLRNSLSHRLLSWSIVIIALLVGLTGIAQFGIIAGGIGFVVTSAPLSAILLGRREAIAVMSFAMCMAIALGTLFVNGYLHYPTDMQRYVLSPNAWVVSLLALFITSSALTAGLLVFNGGLFRVLAISKQQEIDLQTSENRLSLVLEGSRLGFWDWNAVTNDVHFSRTWKTMLGFEEDEIGNDLSEWDKRVHPDDKEAVYADLNAHLNGETSFYENEHRMQCKDGSYKWILDCGQVVSWTEEGKPLRVAGTHTDITQRKEAELKNRRLTQELQSALKNRHPLSGLLPICASCKDVRDDKGRWSKIETYISSHSNVDFSHGVCPTCAKKLYPDIDFGTN